MLSFLANEREIDLREEYKQNEGHQIAILTISDTRTEESDKGGTLVWQLAEESGVKIVEKVICKDDELAIRQALAHWFKMPEVDAIITTGGTGIAKRDCSIEAIQPLFTKEMTGFGELFRYVSYTEDIGTKAMLSRAVAGVAHDKMIFVLPGSTGAVRLAMTKLILPELDHIVRELKK